MFKITGALISVSDKSGIIDLATTLNQHGVEILSTGGTYKALCDANISAIEVSEKTGFPRNYGWKSKNSASNNTWRLAWEKRG